MLAKRPLMYLSLPGIALVLGLIWFRRKKAIHCDTGGKIDENCDQELNQKSVRKLQHVQSMPIDCSADKNKNVNNENNKICKSAPIDINPKKNSPVKISDQRIDMDILKMKIQVCEDKVLNSIRENDFESVSPLDLPDSVDRRRFSFPIKKTDNEPIVIKATTPAKISPKHSFVESKFHENLEDALDRASKSPDSQDLRNHKDDISQEDVEELISKSTDLTSFNNSPTTRTNAISPPLSISSLQSTDSGKGSSPPHSIGAPILVYEFRLPQKLIGPMLGRKGAFVRHIRNSTGANVMLKKHPDSIKMKICTIEGTQKEIEAALKMIRKKFPEKRYPKLTMDRVRLAPPLQTIISSVVSPYLKLQLIEGMNNDVSICSSPHINHLFFHQPLHPSYPALQTLQKCMNQTYAFCNSPELTSISIGNVCAAFLQHSWLRVEIKECHDDNKTALVKSLDYGYSWVTSYVDLRQIRTDFMTLPFQAIECYLSNVKPTGAEYYPGVAQIIDKITLNRVLQAQVSGYTDDGVPLIKLYSRIGPNQFVFINKVIVAKELAEWVDDAPSQL